MDIKQNSGYFYIIYYDSIYLCKIAETEAEDSEEKKKKEVKAKKGKIETLLMDMKKRREEFIGDIIKVKAEFKDKDHIINSLLSLLIENCRLISLYGIEEIFLPEEKEQKRKNALLNLAPEYQLMLIAENNIGNGITVDSQGKYRKRFGEQLIALCKIFEEAGLELCEEERQILDGTHELYASTTAAA